jgi:hypothetical protein
VDDRFFSHPKIVGTSLAARGLWITALSWSSSMETDGRIPASVLQVFSPYDPDPLTNELVARGLWERTEDGFRVHDFLDWNPSRETLVARRQAANARLIAHRERKRDSNALQARSCNASETPAPSRPDPSHKRERRSLSRATQWPDDFTLTLDRADVGRELGVDVTVEWNKFKDHALKDGVTHKNWDAAWRYWCRRVPEFQRRKTWGS